MTHIPIVRAPHGKGLRGRRAKQRKARLSVAGRRP